MNDDNVKTDANDNEGADAGDTGTYLDDYDPRARAMVEKHGYGDTKIPARSALNRLFELFVLCAALGEEQVELAIIDAKMMFKNLAHVGDLDLD